MSIKLVLEMEAGDQLTGENNEVEAANVATEVEAATAELTEVGGEAEEYSEGIETSVDAAGELQEVHDTLGASVEDGEGVSEETAKMAEIAVEAICAKVGISAREARMIPAMESFGSANSRLTATKLAMEGIKETATRIWEAIKKAAIHVWNVVKSFFAGLVKSRAMLEKHLTNLKARAGNAKGDPKEKKISTGAKAFTIDGTASLDTVYAVLDDSVALAPMSVKLGEIADHLAMVGVDREDVNAAFKGAMSKLQNSKSSKTMDNGKTAHGRLVNGRAIVVTPGKDDAIPTLAVETTEKTFAKEIDAPTKEQIVAMLEKATKALTDLKEFDKVSKTLEKVTKLTTDYADKMIKAASSGSDDDKTKEEGKKTAETMKGINNMISKVGVACPSLMFGAIKAVADYANAGLNNLVVEKK